MKNYLEAKKNQLHRTHTGYLSACYMKVRPVYGEPFFSVWEDVTNKICVVCERPPIVYKGNNSYIRLAPHFTWYPFPKRTYSEVDDREYLLDRLPLLGQADIKECVELLNSTPTRSDVHENEIVPNYSAPPIGAFCGIKGVTDAFILRKHHPLTQKAYELDYLPYPVYGRLSFAFTFGDYAEELMDDFGVQYSEDEEV